MKSYGRYVLSSSCVEYYISAVDLNWCQKEFVHDQL